MYIDFQYLLSNLTFAACIKEVVELIWKKSDDNSVFPQTLKKRATESLIMLHNEVKTMTLFINIKVSLQLSFSNCHFKRQQNLKYLKIKSNFLGGYH